MSIRSKYTFSILAILAITMSVYACTGVSMSSMHGMDMGGLATAFEHMSHVQSLTSAVIPALVLLTLFLCLGVLVYRPVALDFSLVYLHTLADGASPKQKHKKRYFSHPRSPPFC